MNSKACLDGFENNITRRSSNRLASRSISKSHNAHKDHDDHDDEIHSDSDSDDNDDVLVEQRRVIEDYDDNNDKNGYDVHEDDVVTTLSRNAFKNSRPPPPHPKKRRWHSTSTVDGTDEVLKLKNTRGSKSSSSSSSSSAAATAGAVTAADFDTNGDHDVFQEVKRSRGRPRKIITPIDDDLFREIVMKYTHIDSSTDWAKVMMELPVGHNLNIGKCRNRWRKMNISPEIAHSTAIESDVIKSGHDRYDPMIEMAFFKQARRKDPDELKYKTKWTHEMDAHLSEAVVLHGPKWKIAAELVGNNIDKSDCHRRWHQFLKPRSEGYKNHDWTVDEYYELKDLVLTHTSMGRKTPDKVTINWSFISKKMNRKYNACRHTWNHICNQSLIQGHFTKEEDDIICRKVKDALNSTSTGTLPHGFWVAIGEELNRIPYSVTRRWNRYLSTL